MPLGKHVAVHLLMGVFLLLAADRCPAVTPDVSVPPAASSSDTLTVGQAIVLGVIEGLTEYLPVSSTGHLLVAEHFMNISEAPSASSKVRVRTKHAIDAYIVCIQVGAIIAVFGLYFRRVRQMLRGLLGKDRDGRLLLVNIASGFLPAAVIGLLFDELIKKWLFGTWPVVLAWLVGGLAILAIGWRRQGREQPERQTLPLEALTWRMALVIGFAQCIAMWPGVSRSLVTIVGGVLVGLSLPAAVEFSFLLGLITLGAATGYDALKNGELMLQTFDLWSMTVGVVAAFLSAVVSVKWMVGYLKRHGLAIFGYYRVALALITGAMLMGGLM